MDGAIPGWAPTGNEAASPGDGCTDLARCSASRSGLGRTGACLLLGSSNRSCSTSFWGNPCGTHRHLLYMNSSEAQITWLVLIFSALVCTLLALFAIASAEATISAQIGGELVPAASQTRQANPQFLVWGSSGAMAAVAAMSWVRRASRTQLEPQRRRHY